MSKRKHSEWPLVAAGKINLLLMLYLGLNFQVQEILFVTPRLTYLQHV